MRKVCIEGRLERLDRVGMSECEGRSKGWRERGCVQLLPVTCLWKSVSSGCFERERKKRLAGYVGVLATIVKRRKLKWYGHVSRSSGLAKTILQGTVKGGRRQGRQKKKWEDNIREWKGLEFAKSQRAVENREKWRKLVVKSSVVPQRPSRFREWMMMMR